MDGLLVVDKPSGPTSHDVVARIRRALREQRIGHTGTLDPMATGILLLVVGKATRLAKFLSGSDKSYDAVVRLGFATDTADAQGQRLGPVIDRAMPSRAAIDAALDAFRGTFLQQPPAFSAKKIDGQRSYKLARDARLEPSRDKSNPPGASDLRDRPDPPALPSPCRVTTTRLEIVSIEADRVTLSMDCSAGFYVRSLAHDLGERLGVGAHLSALRRTRNGDFGLDVAVELDAAERDPAAAVSAMRSLAGMLPRLAAVVLTAEGVDRVGHGQDVRPIDHEPSAISRQPFLRLLDHTGALVAIAEPAAAGVLHPSVVLV
jgi:tRNA pseudouridine55 synthase